LLDAFETLRRSVKLNYTIKGREVWLEWSVKFWMIYIRDDQPGLSK
jgi:hypothetical protein